MATALKTPSPITVDQYRAFEGFPGLKDELIEGRIVMSPQPKPLHQYVLFQIQSALHGVIDKNKYVVLSNSNIEFGLTSMPAPDVFVVEKKALEDAARKNDHLANPPIMAVEILSPSNKKGNVEDKIEIYLNGGVAEVWIVSIKKKSLRRVTKESQGVIIKKGAISLPHPLSGTVMLESFFAGINYDPSKASDE